MDDDKNTICPHCGSRMKKCEMPPEATWGVEYQYICFNDECPYYEKGWDWMSSRYNVLASYRYRYNPANGETGPFPVWSENAMKNRIIED